MHQRRVCKVKSRLYGQGHSYQPSVRSSGKRASRRSTFRIQTASDSSDAAKRLVTSTTAPTPVSAMRLTSSTWASNVSEICPDAITPTRPAAYRTTSRARRSRSSRER